MTDQTHQEMLQKYAEAIVKVGLNLRSGQRLIITLAATRGVPHQFAPLVREVAKAAYAVGAMKKCCACAPNLLRVIPLMNIPPGRLTQL
jgi:leucyl aminopeptidase (aminopeptidase T)